MYRVLLLSETNSVPGDFAQSYFKLFAGDKAEVFAAAMEIGRRNKMVKELLSKDSVKITDESLHKVQDFQSIDFDFILTLDEASEEESHHFSSHIIKYHYNYADLLPERFSGDEKHEAYLKLRDRIKEDMHAFVKEHFSADE